MLASQLNRYKDRIENALDRFLPSVKKDPILLHEAMRYAILSQGKRLRPTLLYLTAESFGAQLDVCDRAAVAIECIHTYSLIHDDLPAMDDDSLRRGQPTCHVRFDEATAILAGDALQALAFQLLSEPQTSHHLSCEKQLALMHVLSCAINSTGMVGGQILDMAATKQRLDINTLQRIHQLKTGALINACVEIGALCANLFDPVSLRALRQYAHCLGLAFQIQDDWLEATKTTETLGKDCGTDTRLEKNTYVRLLGISGAKRAMDEFMQKAIDALDGLRMKPLQAFVHYVWERTN